MNGAYSLVKTFLGGGVDVCFANPGTSEMHFVAALDDHPDMRCVLCLFEGGVSGAADGYYRMSGKVAATLLHLAPGFGNAYANVHNARKAGSAMINVVGDHADYHLKYDSPLKGDVVGVCQSISQWTRWSENAAAVAGDGAAAVAAARDKNGQIASLILPANTAWEEAPGPVPVPAPVPLYRPSATQIKEAARRLSEPGAALLVGGAAGFAPLSDLAGKIAAHTGCRLLIDCLFCRMERGQGAVAIDRLPYVVEDNMKFLSGIKNMVLLGSKPPVCFFAYPGKPSTPEPADCMIHDLCSPEMDIAWTLEALVAELGANDTPARRTETPLPELETGPIELEGLVNTIGALLPEGAIISDESVTSGRLMGPILSNARRHDVLLTTGGAIGQCLPAAVGAAVACPDRKVVALSGDGSAMYTLQSLWTMAREELDVTVVIFANRGYQILRGELANLGVEQVGKNAVRMFDVDEPLLDWVALAKGHGVEATRVTSLDDFARAFANGVGTPGPSLIEVMM